MSADGPTDARKRSKHLLVIDDDEMIPIHFFVNFSRDYHWPCRLFSISPFFQARKLLAQLLDLIGEVGHLIFGGQIHAV